ncbi:MAG: DUF58 domain-containing protein [Candidatus Babeliales bacterium]
MLAKEIIERIKHIQIRTKRLLGGTRAGDHVTRQKGFGLDFDQIREYQQGDDVRYIDWKSSARSGKMLVKQYYQEHSRTIMLVVDCSRSLFFGSGKETKYHVAATVASILALVGQQSKDRVSLVLFDDDIELYIPPRSGYGHVQKIMHTLFDFSRTSRASGVTRVAGLKTNYAQMLRFVGSKKTNDSVIFLLSDFIDFDDESLLSSLARKSELVAVRCLDPLERALPGVGLLALQDIETGERIEINAALSQLKEVSHLLSARLFDQNALFARYGVDVFDATSCDDMIKGLIRFFRKRAN